MGTINIGVKEATTRPRLPQAKLAMLFFTRFIVIGQPLDNGHPDSMFLTRQLLCCGGQSTTIDQLFVIVQNLVMNACIPSDWRRSDWSHAQAMIPACAVKYRF